MRVPPLQSQFPNVLSGARRVNPKPESRRPKEGRNPKVEEAKLRSRGAALSDDCPGRPLNCGSIISLSGCGIGGFGLRNSAFFRPSGFGFRSSRASRSPVEAVKQRGAGAGRRGAFTLIEVVISASLMALIIVSAYLCLNAAVSSQKLIEPRATVFQNARVAMALMAADLRGACPLSKDSAFLGMHRMIGAVEADNIDFATHNYTPRRPREGDYCQVSLYLDKEPESGQFVLYRRRNPTIALDPLTGGNREEIARGLLGLRFDYYDGYEWYESWGEVDRRSKAQTSRRERYNLADMPQAVRITLWFDSNPKPKPAESPDAAAASPATEEPAVAPPLVFQTVAQLNLATALQNASTSGADSSGQGAQPGQTGGPNQ